MIQVYKTLTDMERDQLLSVSSNASTRVHQVKLVGGKFETHERTWLFLLHITVVVKFYINTGKSGKVNEREMHRE